MTYQDIFEEACRKFNLHGKVKDYRPAVELYIPQLKEKSGIPGGIIIWLTDGTKMIYINDIGIKE